MLIQDPERYGASTLLYYLHGIIYDFSLSWKIETFENLIRLFEILATFFSIPDGFAPSYFGFPSKFIAKLTLESVPSSHLTCAIFG